MKCFLFIIVLFLGFNTLQAQENKNLFDNLDFLNLENHQKNLPIGFDKSFSDENWIRYCKGSNYIFISFDAKGEVETIATNDEIVSGIKGFRFDDTNLVWVNKN